MNIVHIIRHFYDTDTYAYEALIAHSRNVARKAVHIAKNISGHRPDIHFIGQAAMLHDIGMIRTHAPDIGCTGTLPYITHGIQGRQMLESLSGTYNLSAHAMVCERHTGAGLSAEDIRSANLPLPVRDMMPVTIEEKIICFADKFFSKNPETCHQEKPLSSVLDLMASYGPGQINRFLEWKDLFGYE